MNKSYIDLIQIDKDLQNEMSIKMSKYKDETNIDIKREMNYDLQTLDLYYKLIKKVIKEFKSLNEREKEEVMNVIYSIKNRKS